MNANKAAILQAASDIFLKGGAEALSVRAIASKAGVSTMGIYSHFEGKQGILEALYIEGFTVVDQAMSVLDGDLSPREAVLAAANNYFDLAQDNPAHYRLVFGQGDAGYAPSAAAREAGEKAFGKLLALARRALPPAASDAQQQMAALRIWSLMHGAVSLQQHAVAESVDMGLFRQNVLDSVLILIDGIAAEVEQQG